MSSNPCNYMITGVETIGWQTRVAYGCLVAGQSPWAWALTSANRLYAYTVYDTKVQLQYAARGSI